MIYGAEHEAYARLDAYKPQVQAAANALLGSFQDYVSTQDISALRLQEQSVEGLLNLIVKRYLQAHPILPDASAGSLGFVQSAGFEVLNRFQAALISHALNDVVAKRAADYTGLSNEVIVQALKTPFASLFQADGLLALAKRQTAGMVRGFYVALSVQLLLMLSFVGSEIALYRYLMRRRTLPAGAYLPEAV